MTDLTERIDDLLTTEDVPGPPVPSETAIGLVGFSARDLPWGRLGATLPTGVTSAAEAARLGGLDFEVTLRPSGFRSQSNHGTWKRVAPRFACVRADDETFFDFVSHDYTPIQYAEAFAFLDSLADEGLTYVAAGTPDGHGKQAFIVVQLPEAQTIELATAQGTDRSDLYVVVRASHNRTHGLELALMGLRGRCMNALALQSFTRGAVQKWSIRHVGKEPMSRLREARLVLTRTRAYAEEFERIAQQLLETDLLVEDAQRVLAHVLPSKPRTPDTINKIVAAWQESPTNGFRDNGWGLLNAVSEFYEWGRPEGLRTPASRFTSGLTGPTQRYVNRTAQLLLARR